MAGFFNPLLAWLDHTVREGFVPVENRGLLLEAEDPERLLDLLGHYRPAEPQWRWLDETER